MRVATFNVENLFSRAKVLNIRKNEKSTTLLTTIGELNDELQKTIYDKAKIFKLYQEVKSVINIRENRGKLFKKIKTAIKGVAANGKSDWDGEIEFKRESFNEMARKATARVIKEIKPDVLCLVEVEDRLTVERFHSELLKSKTFNLKYNMCIDGNDLRGIDVALLSKYPIKNIYRFYE